MDYAPINYFKSKYKLSKAYFIFFNIIEVKTMKDIECCYPREISKEIYNHE
ncbi:hypothetical protein HY745_08680 [Candidatus Desantisbacteria bacterium]|nr:hypothetical protein [Candidatus Desantisbacteria bacterium]